MKSNTLEMLTAMNEAQTTQFMAATLLAIAIVMKKAGLEEVTVGADDMQLLRPGETLEPVPNMAGGYTYRFKRAPGPLEKLPTPKAMKKSRK